MKKTYLLLLLTAFIFSCKNDPKPKDSSTEIEEITAEEEKSPALSLAETIETTHHKEDFMNNETVTFDLKLNFGGKERFNGKITMKTNSSKIKMEKKDGTIVIYNGDDVFLSPKENNYDGARFDIFTWSYFFALPFKLTDEGTNWQEKQERKLDSANYNSAKLTFGENIGDAPDDWYVIYSDKQTNLLKAAAYIVTYGDKEISKAEENPHAIVYERYFTVKSVPVAKYWKFYNWSEEKGVYDEPIGDAEISNLKYLSANEANFDILENAIEVKK